MAQIEQSDKGGKKKKKGAQKKMSIHVDFTPMVDMNMLLITFFMLCTTMIKSQTLQITLPNKDKNENQQEQQKDEANKKNGVTMFVTTDRGADGNPIKGEDGRYKNTIYYYMGAPEDVIVFDTEDTTKMVGVDKTKFKTEEFIGNEGSTQRGIRKILHDKNKDVLDEIDKLKTKWKNKEFSSDKDENDRLYQEEAKKVRSDTNIKTKAVVVIKPFNGASWESVINALDEMQINHISRYQIENLNSQDSAMLRAYGLTFPEDAKN